MILNPDRIGKTTVPRQLLPITSIVKNINKGNLMKTKTMIVALATLLIGSLCFMGCQKDELESPPADFRETAAFHTTAMKASSLAVDYVNHCIDPENPNWLELNDSKTTGWGGRNNNQFTKTVDIIYYNTLDAFVVRVKSTENIANLHVDNQSVKDFSRPLSAGLWHDLSLPLPHGWQAGDDFHFQLSVIGNGPQTVFDVEYKLVGECHIGPDAFVTTWNTQLGNGTSVSLGLSGTVDATIFWGDGKFSQVNAAGPHTHDYGKDGIYTVKVTGHVTSYFGWNENRDKLISVDSWGNLGFTSMVYAFPSANLISVPNTTAGLESVTNMTGLFYGATSFNQDIGNWDVSNVTNMVCMFQASSFNRDIGGWDVSNVTSMMSMFSHSPFNQDISAWDVSSVIYMQSMFWEARHFNQDIGSWNVSTVANMNWMFMDASAFNQDLSGWCVPNIANTPTGFDDGATSWILPRPVWGTCP
jgi:surface protein